MSEITDTSGVFSSWHLHSQMLLLPRKHANKCSVNQQKEFATLWKRVVRKNIIAKSSQSAYLQKGVLPKMKRQAFYQDPDILGESRANGYMKKLIRQISAAYRIKSFTAGELWQTRNNHPSAIVFPGNVKQVRCIIKNSYSCNNRSAAAHRSGLNGGLFYGW